MVYGSKQNRKNDIYPLYRTGRKVRINFDEKQFGQLVNICSNLNVTQLKMEGVEADQLLAACVNRLDECTIISEDKDFFQLLTDTKVLKGKKRGLWDAKRVCTAYNLKDAALFADFQALIGDSSDNIPRIVSSNSAIELLNLKGRLDEWLLDGEPDYTNVPKLLVNKLSEKLPQLKVNYELVDLRQEQFKKEYLLPVTLDLVHVKEKLKNMNMNRFLYRFNEFERMSTLQCQ
jgi:5'-3' exonuclease